MAKSKIVSDYLTDDEPSHIVPGGERQSKENPKSRQAEGKNASEESDITHKVKPTTVVPEPEARAMEGFDGPSPINRSRPEGSPEAMRQRWNRFRDMRTNLGVGKPSIVETE